tara:strand:+ start:228 stop:455 length:228 start_codon:yes stop_codon:yes gene_type:complete
MIRKIQQHLKDANKTYFEHQRFAFLASLICLKSAFTAFIHGLCPALFEYNTSTNIKKMYNDMQPIYKMREMKSKN